MTHATQASVLLGILGGKSTLTHFELQRLEGLFWGGHLAMVRVLCYFGVALGFRGWNGYKAGYGRCWLVEPGRIPERQRNAKVRGLLAGTRVEGVRKPAGFSV